MKITFMLQKWIVQTAPEIVSAQICFSYSSKAHGPWIYLRLDVGCLGIPGSSWRSLLLFCLWVLQCKLQLKGVRTKGVERGSCCIGGVLGIGWEGHIIWTGFASWSTSRTCPSNLTIPILQTSHKWAPSLIDDGSLSIVLLMMIGVFSSFFPSYYILHFISLPTKFGIGDPKKRCRRRKGV